MAKEKKKEESPTKEVDYQEVHQEHLRNRLTELEGLYSALQTEGVTSISKLEVMIAQTRSELS